MREFTSEEQDMIKRGAEAAELLSNPVIASAINEFSDALTTALLSTNPDENQKRERIFNIHFALKELVAILSHRVSLKQNIEAQMENQEND